MFKVNNYRKNFYVENVTQYIKEYSVTLFTQCYIVFQMRIMVTLIYLELNRV